MYDQLTNFVASFTISITNIIFTLKIFNSFTDIHMSDILNKASRNLPRGYLINININVMRVAIITALDSTCPDINICL